MNEKEIIQGLRDRKNVALQMAIHEYLPTVKRVVNSVMTTSQEKESVEEIVNDVLLTIWYNIDAYDETKGEFIHWLISVSKFKAIDYKRKIARQKEQHEFNDSIYMHEEQVEEENNEQFYEKIASLSQKDKEIFIKRYLNEDSIEDIAEELGISVDNVYQRLSRGRNKIKRALHPV